MADPRRTAPPSSSPPPARWRRRAPAPRPGALHLRRRARCADYSPHQAGRGVDANRESQRRARRGRCGWPSRALLDHAPRRASAPTEQAVRRNSYLPPSQRRRRHKNVLLPGSVPARRSRQEDGTTTGHKSRAPAFVSSSRSGARARARAPTRVVDPPAASRARLGGALMTGDCAPNVIGQATASWMTTSTRRLNPLSTPISRARSPAAGHGSPVRRRWRRCPSPMHNLKRKKRAPHAQKARTIASPVTRGCCGSASGRSTPGTPGATTDGTRATGRGATDTATAGTCTVSSGRIAATRGSVRTAANVDASTCAGPVRSNAGASGTAEVPGPSMADALTMSVSSPNSPMSTRAEAREVMGASAPS